MEIMREPRLNREKRDKKLAKAFEADGSKLDYFKRIAFILPLVAQNVFRHTRQHYITSL